MNIADIGGFGVMWLNKNGLTNGQNSAWAFFHKKDEAVAFMNSVGGELYVRHGDGRLTRA